MIEATQEARAAAATFSKIKSDTQNDEIRVLARGLEHLARAVQVLADPEMAKLALGRISAR